MAKAKVLKIPARGDWEFLMHGDVIVGDTFVCAHDGEGRSVGLSDAQELALRRRLRELGV